MAVLLLEISKIQKEKQVNFKKISRFMVKINKIAKDQAAQESLAKSFNPIGQLFSVKYVKNIKYIIDRSNLSSYTPANQWPTQNQQSKE